MKPLTILLLRCIGFIFPGSGKMMTIRIYMRITICIASRENVNARVFEMHREYTGRAYDVKRRTIGFKETSAVVHLT